jgi:hypothetical protein
MPHPKICAFEQTANVEQDLILVIGRAPNTPDPIENNVGPYDFRNAPRCGFWNSSYSTFASIANRGCREFKTRCVNQHSSPIIYADSVPFGIPAATPTAQVIQLLNGHIQNPNNVRQHIREILRHEIIRRVRAVFLSGLHCGSFHDYYQLILPAFQQKLNAARVPWLQVPFFRNSNNQAIQQTIKSLSEK